MSAFAAALAAIYADPNLAVAADYRMTTGGPPIPNIRVILTTPDGPGSPARASISVAGFGPHAPPQRKDQLELHDGRIFVVEDAELDPEGIEWTMRLSTTRP